MKTIHYKICFPGCFNGKKFTKFINLFFLIPELCFFMRRKLYPANLANAHAQIIFCGLSEGVVSMVQSPFGSINKLRK